MSASLVDPAAEKPLAGAGFAQQAARLVEAARANERAVRGLEEAAQALASGVDELAVVAEASEAFARLGERLEEARAVAEVLEDASESAADLAAAADAVELAARRAQDFAERAQALGASLDAVGEKIERLEGSLGGALARLERIDAVEATLDRLLALFCDQADAYAARVEPQLARLEAVAERMDAPAVADELADVLATTCRLLEAVEGSDGR